MKVKSRNATQPNIHPSRSLRWPDRATITQPSEDLDAVELDLLDNGQGADAQAGDGVYSRYYTLYSGAGRYSVEVQVRIPWDKSVNGNKGFQTRWWRSRAYLERKRPRFRKCFPKELQFFYESLLMSYLSMNLFLRAFLSVLFEHDMAIVLLFISTNLSLLFISTVKYRSAEEIVYILRQCPLSCTPFLYFDVIPIVRI